MKNNEISVYSLQVSRVKDGLIRVRQISVGFEFVSEVSNYAHDRLRGPSGQFWF